MHGELDWGKLILFQRRDGRTPGIICRGGGEWELKDSD
ncbi:hypothetical protein SAMN05216308_106132 [Nitrosospira sp. Nsp13]|nr:hypothetical protein SAMN05216308_106132 [Nitrosospira sp. Nsp13]